MKSILKELKYVYKIGIEKKNTPIYRRRWNYLPYESF
jgi:hypothetical protein